MVREIRGVVSLFVVLALSACGGGGSSDSPAPPPPPVANVAPVAAFTSATTVVAGVPLALDAGTSTDADSDPLTYSWNFGNGQNGGGQKIAPVFDAAGTFNIRLTVDDARGGSHAVQKTITVTAGPVALGNVNTLAVVRDASGALLSGVAATVTSTGGASGSTGTDGRVTLATDRGIPVTLKFSKVGYADQFKTIELPASAESGYLTITMLARESAQTLASAAAGGALTGKDGAKVTFAPNSIVDANGAAVSGPVQVAMTPVNVATNERSFPGRFAGVRTNGDQGPIVSYGTVEFSLGANGSPVQLAPGKKATIEIPIYTKQNLDGSELAIGNTFPLWSLNEKTGGWTEEGVGTVVQGTSPSDFALRGEVTHFTWWNHDQFASPAGYPKPKCLVDSNHDGIYEDLTGTGYCFHEAQVNPVQSSGASGFAKGMQLKLLADPISQRVPAYGATLSAPPSGGVALPIPANVDVVIRSFANNGTLFGSKIIRVGANVQQDIEMRLDPIQDATGTTRLTLPYSNVFGATTGGEVDHFVFAARAGTSYDVRISSPAVSVLGGSVRVASAASAQLAAGTFGNDPFLATVTASAAGDLSIDVTANANAPGTYLIEVTPLSNSTCGSPASLAIPSTTNNIAMPANGVKCFNITLAADDVLEITNSQQVNARGVASLISPSGEQLIVDPYGDPTSTVQLYVAVVQAGVYRLQITNSAATNGTMNGLSVAKIIPDGTIAVPGNATFAGPSNLVTSHFYVVKPSVLGSEFALLFDANGINQGLRVHPGTALIPTSNLVARVLSKPVGTHPLVQITRGGQTAWNFQLTTSVPLSLALNTDITLTAPIANQPLIYRFTGSVGQEVRAGTENDIALNVSPSVTLATASLPANPINGSFTHTLNEEGVQTALVTESFGGSGNFNFRVNTIGATTPITLSALTDINTTLALGDLKRYSFDVTQGQIMSLQLSSPTELDATASLEGTSVIGAVNISHLSGGPLPRTVSSNAFFVNQTGPATLALFPTGRFTGSASGSVTARVSAPMATPTALGSHIAVTLNKGELRTYAYNVATAGRHLLCYRNESPAVFSESLIDTKVWGPAPNGTNGDLRGIGEWAASETIGTLRAGANVLSLISPVEAPQNFHVALVDLAAPTALTLNAAATNSSLSTCQRGYFNFAGTANQAYTVRVNANFAGTVHVHKLSATGDPTQREASGGDVVNVGGTPLPLVSGVERVVTFTIPNTAQHGTGTYIVDVDATEEATGSYTVSVTSP